MFHLVGVNVKNTEFEVLLLLKKVLESKRGSEIRIKIIVNLLCLSNQEVFCCTRIFHVDVHDRITNRYDVQVDQVSARDTYQYFFFERILR